MSRSRPRRFGESTHLFDGVSKVVATAVVGRIVCEWIFASIILILRIPLWFVGTIIFTWGKGYEELRQRGIMDPSGERILAWMAGGFFVIAIASAVIAYKNGGASYVALSIFFGWTYIVLSFIAHEETLLGLFPKIKRLIKTVREDWWLYPLLAIVFIGLVLWRIAEILHIYKEEDLYDEEE